MNGSVLHTVRATTRVVIGLVLIAGCTPALSARKATLFGESAEGARLVLQTTIDDTQSVATEAEIDRALSRPDRRLLDSDFTPIIPAKTRAALLTQFDVLVDYSRLLRKITDKTYRGEIASAVSKLNGAATKALDDAAALGETLNGAKLASDDTIGDVKKGIGVLSGVAAAVGEVAIDRYAQQKAYEIVTTHAAEISDYCRALQKVLKPTDGADDERESIGLVALTRVAYRERRNALQIYFHSLDARPSTMTEIEWRKYRKHVVQQYADLVAGEERAKTQIVALRSAIGKIANAHTALAKKDDVGFTQEISDAMDYVKFIANSYQTGKKAE